MVSLDCLVLATFRILTHNAGSTAPRVLPILQTRMMTHRNRDGKSALNFIRLEFNRHDFLGFHGQIPGQLWKPAR